MDIRKLVQNIGGSALQQARNAQNTYKSLIERPVVGAKNAVKEFTYSPQTLPKDWMYRAQNISNRYQRNAPGIAQLKNVNEVGGLDKVWEEASPIGRLGFDVFNDPINKSPSANYKRYNYLAPEETAIGAGAKNAILGTPALHPGLKSYIKTIPFSEQHDETSAGTFYGVPEGEEYISIDPRNNPENQRRVAAHEMMHAASSVLGRERLGNFVVDVNRAYRQNPEAFAPIMQWISDYKTSREGTGYFNDPLAEAEELFAEVGSMYGPRILSHPILGQYYRNIYQNTGENWPPPMVRYEDGSVGIARQ